MKKLLLSLSIIVSSGGYADTPVANVATPNDIITSSKSKKLHTLDYARLQKNRIVTSVETKKVDTHKKVLVATSKKLHTLDRARLQKNRIVTLAETKKVDTRKKVLVATSKKLHTLVRVPKTKIVKVKKTIKTGTIKRIAIVKPKKLQKIVKQNVHPLQKAEKRVTLSDIFFKSSRSHVASANTKDGKATNIINIAKTKLGKKYVWGAVGKRGTFDCSGFTSYVYKKNGIHIPRTSRNQAKYGKFIARNELKKGDLIFFDTSRHRKGYVNHVGIYLGNGKFIHASSAQKRVVVSSLSKFYAQRYVGARRPS